MFPSAYPPPSKKNVLKQEYTTPYKLQGIQNTVTTRDMTKKQAHKTGGELNWSTPEKGAQKIHHQQKWNSAGAEITTNKHITFRSIKGPLPPRTDKELQRAVHTALKTTGPHLTANIPTSGSKIHMIHMPHLLTGANAMVP